MTTLPRILADSLTTVDLSPAAEPIPPRLPRPTFADAQLDNRAIILAAPFPDPIGSTRDFLRNETFRKLAQMQFFSLWCWNAVGAAVASFYIRKLLGPDADLSGFQKQCSNLQYAVPPRPTQCQLRLKPTGPTIGSYIPFMASSGPIAWPGTSNYDFAGQPEWIVNRTGLVTARRVRYNGAGRPSVADINEVIRALSNGHVVVMHLRARATTSKVTAHVVTIYGTKLVNRQRVFLIADPQDDFREWPDIPDQWIWEQSIFFDLV